MDNKKNENAELKSVVFYNFLNQKQKNHQLSHKMGIMAPQILSKKPLKPVIIQELSYD